MNIKKSVVQNRSIIQTVMMVIMTSLMATGCVTIQRKPIAVDVNAFEKGIEPIMIMPIVDARADKSVSFDKDDSDKLRALVIKRLQGLGYSAQACDSWKSSVSPQQLSDMNEKELCRLLPPNAKSAMIISVDGLRDSYKVLVTSFSISATFTVIDISGQKEIWKDAAVGEHGGGGVLDAAVAQIGKRSGAYNALVDTVFPSFPKKANRTPGAR